MNIRVVVSKVLDGTTVFNCTSDHAPMVGDRIVWAGESMRVIDRTWYVGLDKVVSLSVWVESD